MNNKGKITRETDGFKIVFERILSHRVDKVWDAISNPEKLKVWFTDIEMELKPESNLRILFRDAAKTVTTGKIIAVEPPHRFVWTWEGELAEWELTPLQDNRCKLVFTYSKLSNRYTVGATAGFHTLLERLEMFLQGNLTLYPFGTEDHDPAQVALREEYGAAIYDRYPELEEFHPLLLKREFAVSREKLWAALTDNEALKAWYFDFKGKFKLQLGHEFEWEAGPPDGKKWLHRGRILKFVPEELLVHSWEYPGYSGQARLSWELSEVTKDRTHLQLQFDFVQPFDFNVEALRRKHFNEGWQYIIFTALPDYLQS